MTDINNYKLTTLLNVTFIRKNKKYIKDIFILMNDSIKKNIMEKENTQYFADTTYDAVPHQNSHMKLFVLLSYNKLKNKILLCTMALIYNENTETLETIFKFLKINYFFNPTLITVDFGKAGLKVITKLLPKTRIFPCYFHLIRRLKIHIKSLNSTNKVIKRSAKNL